ncbi:hypothetical protein ACTRXD_11870 [Nitrospira sp. T9]|uniref:hypothetical protein n=1 Tax=unclassified Nitrospira TaxID=2652172 RepID=UPI003F9691D3
MRVNGIACFGIFLMVHLYYDCTISNAQTGQEMARNGSFAYTLKKEKVTQTQEMIATKFKSLFSVYAKEQNEEKTLPFSRQEARQKARRENIVRSGFQNLAELEHVKVIEPLVVTSIRLDELKNYKSGETDPRNLIRKSDTAIFQVKGVNDPYQNKKTVSQTFVVVVPEKDGNGHDSQFRIIQYGPSTIYGSLFEARREVESKESQVFIVWIPAMTQFLLGEITTNQEFKLKVMDSGMKNDEFSNQFKGKFAPAREIFDALAKEVNDKEYDYPPWDLKARPQAKQNP